MIKCDLMLWFSNLISRSTSDGDIVTCSFCEVDLELVLKQCISEVEIPAFLALIDTLSVKIMCTISTALCGQLFLGYLWWMER